MVRRAPHLQCPNCHCLSTTVTDGPEAGRFNTIRRRHQCLSCGHNFTSYQHPGVTPQQELLDDLYAARTAINRAIRHMKEPKCPA